MYTYKIFFNHYKYPYEYLNTNLYYTYIDNENDLNIITNDDRFYLLISDKSAYIYTNNILSNYEIKYSKNIDSTIVSKLEKKQY